jgi:hypothetical protein
MYFYFNYSWCVWNVEMEDSHSKITLHLKKSWIFSSYGLFTTRHPPKGRKGGDIKWYKKLVNQGIEDGYILV